MKTGQRSLLSPTRTKKICAALKKVTTVKTACALAGISTTTFHSWVARGESENGGPEYQEFAVSCARARAKAKQKLTNIILKAAPRDPKLACWLLERLYPAEYGLVAEQEPLQTQASFLPAPVIVNVIRNKESDAAVKLFGERPAGRT
jgi:hypothetical protein